MDSASHPFGPAVLRLKDLNIVDLGHRVGVAAVSCLGLLVIFFLIRAVYNIWFHPLSKYPGPWYAATTNLVHYFVGTSGNAVNWLTALHAKHGDVVRIGPARLSYTNPQAWKDIYGHRVGGKRSFLKDVWFYGVGSLFGRPASMISERDDAEHARLRKIFTNAFSDRALRQQQDLLLGYVNQLVKNIQNEIAVDSEHCFDAVRLYNFTTFDIMADLTFGESLGMLQNGEYVPWVAKIFTSMAFASKLEIFTRWMTLGRSLVRMMPDTMKRAEEEHYDYVKNRVDNRIAKGSDDLPDIWNLVMSLPEAKQLDKPMMYEHGSVFMTAGTETTATLLSGLTYYLLRNPEKMERLVKEIRSLPEDSLNLDSLRQLEYMHACFEEALRIYPPVPIGLHRVAPEGGAAVCGDFLPEGTRVYLHQFATYHSERNFKNPWSFEPERWLPGTGYDDDRKEALQPFSTGPRNCIGKNLAYHEMRLILAKVLWNYDIELCPESKDWANQKVYTLWQKHPLYVKVRPAKRT